MDVMKLNDEVFIARNGFVKVTKADVDLVIRGSSANQHRKCRLLLHRSIDDTLHEMVIVHSKGQYIRPHKNVRSSKSFHVIEGALVCVIFSDDGRIVDSWSMGGYSSDNAFITRISDSCFHTLIPLTDSVAFVETILGPFRGTTYAPWAPEEDSTKAREYFESLCRSVGINS